MLFLNSVFCPSYSFFLEYSFLIFFTLIKPIPSLVLTSKVTSGDGPLPSHCTYPELDYFLCFHSTQWKLQSELLDYQWLIISHKDIESGNIITFYCIYCVFSLISFSVNNYWGHVNSSQIKLIWLVIKQLSQSKSCVSLKNTAYINHCEYYFPT